MKVDVKRDIREQHRLQAEGFRRRMLAGGTFVVRLLSSPGAGKTKLLEETARRLAGDYSLGILVGDVETERDAQRLQPYAPTRQITTGGACHLEIPLIEKAYDRLGKGQLEFLFLEDIGNLICPASHDLGEHLRVTLLSTTEGDDKPGKYPKMFRNSDVVVVSKTDLLPHVPFSLQSAIRDAQRIQPDLLIYALSATTQEGLLQWCEFLVLERDRRLANLQDATALR